MKKKGLEKKDYSRQVYIRSMITFDSEGTMLIRNPRESKGSKSTKPKK